MKKVFLAFACVVALLLVGACSGTPSFDKSVCEELKNKIGNDEELTEDDYNSMIDQLAAGVDEMKRLKDETEGDAEKEKALLDDPDFLAMTEYVIGFSLQLEKDAKKLSPDNVKKMAELGKKMKELKD